MKQKSGQLQLIFEQKLSRGRAAKPTAPEMRRGGIVLRAAAGAIAAEH